MNISLPGFYRKTFFLFLGLLLLIVWTSLSSFAQVEPAQQGKILLTWKSWSYAPAQYQGKALPGPGSVITASMEVIDRGKTADLSKNSVYWYLNGSIVGSGVGKKTVNIRVGNRALQEQELKVQIPGYKGQLLFKAIPLFIARPEAIIEAPYAGRSFGSRSVSVRGVPYFFNVTDLSTLIYSWTVNGQGAQQEATSTEGKSELMVNINPDAAIGATLDIGLTIQDPKEKLYYGLKHMTLNLSN